MGWWIGVAVTSLTCHPARWNCRGFESRTHAGGLRCGEKSLCTACVWALVCTQLGRTLAACGVGKSLCVRPVYGLWCAHSFNKPSPSVRQHRRWVQTVSDVWVIRLALKPSFWERDHPDTTQPLNVQLTFSTSTNSLVAYMYLNLFCMPFLPLYFSFIFPSLL